MNNYPGKYTQGINSGYVNNPTQPYYPPPGYTPMYVPYSCPFCRTSVGPIVRSRVSQAGWVVFFVLLCLIITCEICWLGLLITENVVQCPMCGGNLKGMV